MIAAHEINPAIRAPGAGEPPDMERCDFSGVGAVLARPERDAERESAERERRRREHAHVGELARDVVHRVWRVERLQGAVGFAEHGRAERDRHLHDHVLGLWPQRAREHHGHGDECHAGPDGLAVGVADQRRERRQQHAHLELDECDLVHGVGWLERLEVRLR